MFKFLIIPVLVLASFVAGPKVNSYADSPPVECSSMTFTKTIYVTSAFAYIPDGGVLLVYGRPILSNNVTIPYASQVCYVGSTGQDTVTTGHGDDVLIGNGSTGTRDSLNGNLGNDICYDTVGSVFSNCETVVN